MSYEKIKEYIEDHSFNFLGSKASLKDLETFEYVYEKVMTLKKICLLVK